MVHLVSQVILEYRYILYTAGIPGGEIGYSSGKPRGQKSDLRDWCVKQKFELLIIARIFTLIIFC